ncbi:MAG: hypothetical protein P0111_03915 [Nitrospira sp.]|nr:hypothetical protein [Nitrospira sp.]
MMFIPLLSAKATTVSAERTIDPLGLYQHQGNKDRETDVESAPWFKVFTGERINDHHLSLDDKRKARHSAVERGSARQS